MESKERKILKKNLEILLEKVVHSKIEKVQMQRFMPIFLSLWTKIENIKHHIKLARETIALALILQGDSGSFPQEVREFFHFLTSAYQEVLTSFNNLLKNEKFPLQKSLKQYIEKHFLIPKVKFASCSPKTVYEGIHLLCELSIHLDELEALLIGFMMRV